MGHGRQLSKKKRKKFASQGQRLDISFAMAVFENVTTEIVGFLRKTYLALTLSEIGHG